jgi:hypothetical protein
MISILILTLINRALFIAKEYRFIFFITLSLHYLVIADGGMLSMCSIRARK